MHLGTPRRVVRPLAVTGVALALLLGATAPAQASDPDITQVALSAAVDGSRLTATTTVRASSALSVPELGVCVRSRTGSNFDLPRSGPVRLGPSPTVQTSSRTLPDGDFSIGTCVRTARGWRALPGWRNVVVRRTARPGAPAPATRPLGPSGAWSLRLDQTFGSGPLDRTVWRASRSGADDRDDGPFNPDLEDATFSARNVDASGQQLSLRTTAGGGTVNGRTYGYRSGTVSTEGTFAFGDDTFVEARVKIPRQAGLWPAFWAVPRGDWPPEVDVFEFFDTGNDTRPAFNFHYRDSSGHNQQTGPRLYGDPKVDYRVGWHTYGLQRTNGRLIPWLDGVAYPEVAASGLGDTPLFLILNLSVRKGAKAPAGQSMDVSHVRAWKQG